MHDRGSRSYIQQDPIFGKFMHYKVQVASRLANVSVQILHSSSSSACPESDRRYNVVVFKRQYNTFKLYVSYFVERS